MRVLVGGLVIALTAIASIALAWIACYEVRMCEGGSQAYASYALIAILSLLILSLIHVVSVKLRR